MSFDWTMAGLLRKFAPLADESRVTGNLVCPVCSFTFNDYSVVDLVGDAVRIPNVRREVVGKDCSGRYRLVCGHTVTLPWIPFWADEYVSDQPLGESLMEVVDGSR